jgi:hypothetical protein
LYDHSRRDSAVGSLRGAEVNIAVSVAAVSAELHEGVVFVLSVAHSAVVVPRRVTAVGAAVQCADGKWEQADQYRPHFYYLSPTLSRINT